MNKFLLVIFLVNVVGHLATKNWSGAMGWFCAFLWLGLYELRPTLHALDEKRASEKSDSDSTSAAFRQ